MYPEYSFEAEDRETDVRVFELATGNLQAGFRFPGTLQDLDFSPDGRQLAVVGNPKADERHGYVYVYDANQILKGFGKIPKPLAKDIVYQNALLPSYVRFVPDEQKRAAEKRIAVSTWLHYMGPAEYTGKLIWYSFSKTNGLKKTVECDTVDYITPNSFTASHEYVILTAHHGDQKKFFCYDHSGNFVADVSSETSPAQPIFSKDGKHLIVGQRGDNVLTQVKVYSVAFGQFQVKSTYYGHDSEVVAVALLADGTAISAGGDQNAIHFWSTEHLEGEMTAEINGVGRIVHAVGINEQEQIGIGNRDDLRNEKGEIVLQRMFDLRAMKLGISSIKEAASYRRAQTKFGKLELQWIVNGDNVNLWLLPDGWPFTGVYPVGWYYPTTFGFTENGTVITGASDGKIRVAPPAPDGNYEVPERLLVGHSARMIDHAACGRWLVTTGADQVIRLWFMDDVAESTQMELYPALNLFVGADDEWVIWSQSGYYNASQKGDRRFGYHINRGTDMESLYFPSDRFIKSFFRPDIIQAILEHGSEERALSALENANAKAVDVAKILPPIVELLPNGIVAEKDKVTLKFSVQVLNPDIPITRVWIIQNDQFVWKAPKIATKYMVTLPLTAGPNRFKILAETKSTKAMPLIRVIMGPEKKSETKKKSGVGQPLDGIGTARGGAKAAEAARSQTNTFLSDEDNGTLFILAVGVSTLKNETEDFKSLRFADDDAIGIYNALGRSSFSDKLSKKSTLKNKAFSSVDATILLNEKATKDAILKAVDKISDKIRKRNATKKVHRDVLLVFLSGHGIRRSDDFERELYYWNYDLLKTSTRATGLSFIELGEKITSLPADVILATDACHSGMAGSDLVRGLDPNELAKRIYAINERGLYILNASRSEEFAREHEKIGHGVFTKAILETLEFESDLTMMNLMASIQKRVLYYTNHLQTPVFRMYGDLLPLTIFEK